MTGLKEKSKSTSKSKSRSRNKRGVDWELGARILPGAEARELVPELRGLENNPFYRAIAARSSLSVPPPPPRRLRRIAWDAGEIVLLTYGLHFLFGPVSAWIALSTIVLFLAMALLNLNMLISSYTADPLSAVMPDLAVAPVGGEEFARAAWGIAAASSENGLNAYVDSRTASVIALIILIGFLPSEIIPLGWLTICTYSLAVRKDLVLCALQNSAREMRGRHLQALSRVNPLLYYKTAASGCGPGCVIVLGVWGILVLTAAVLGVSLSGITDPILDLIEVMVGERGGAIRWPGGEPVRRLTCVAFFAGAGWGLGRLRGVWARRRVAANREKLFRETGLFWDILVRRARAGNRS